MNSTDLCPWSVAAFSKGLYVCNVGKNLAYCKLNLSAQDSQLEDIIQKTTISGAACDFQLMAPFANEACSPNLAWVRGRTIFLQVKCHLPHFAEY